MAKRAVEHVRNGKLAIEPRSHEHMWYHFLENIQDWCVSRQLWWGHRIPAYRLHLAGHPDEWIVARSLEEARKKAQEKFGNAASNAVLEQDDDVLDTWFSSGLLPISVFVSDRGTRQHRCCLLTPSLRSDRVGPKATPINLQRTRYPSWRLAPTSSSSGLLEWQCFAKR